MSGYNDIKTEMPSLLLEWNYEKNIGIEPSNVVCGGSNRYWWKCPKCGNEWKSKIGNKIRHGCPSCQSKKHSSYPEYVIYYYLTKIDKTVIHSHQDFGFELDIYIPSKRIGIEYDGSFYHQNKEAKEREKNRKCVEKGITLYRFRENLPELEDTSIDILCTLSNFDMLLSDLIRQIYGDEIDVNSGRDEIYINQLMSYWEEEHSLLKVRPDLALEWDYEKNGVIRPEYVMCNSNKKVGWICANNHHFQTKISERIRGSGCPYCSNRKLLIGFNDLVSQNEKLLKEWNYEKILELILLRLYMEEINNTGGNVVNVVMSGKLQ